MASGRTYEQVRAALYALVPRGIVLGLDPVRTALAAFGDPQNELPAAHIAGTNGKGSVAAMVDAGLRAHGLRVGLYTSPHLHRFAERIRVAGVPTGDDELVRAGSEVLDAMSRGQIPALTFFEAATVIAWDVFARAALDAVVLEVGLGGRLDATNVCSPRVTAVTRIALDHQAQLGTTIAQIAGEKAGILKHGVPCILGAGLRSGEARDVIAAHAARVGAPLRDAPAVRDLGVQRDGRRVVEVETGHETVRAVLALTGRHQVENAGVAAGVLEAWGAPAEAIRAGLEQARWPGRMERIDGFLFDAAHNPDGAQALLEELGTVDSSQPIALVFGASSDKDWRAMLDLLATRVPPARRFYAAAGLKRAEDPAVLAGHGGGRACASIDEALTHARAAVGNAGLVVVCGSIFLVAEARARIVGEASDPPVPM